MCVPVGVRMGNKNQAFINTKQYITEHKIYLVTIRLNNKLHNFYKLKYIVKNIIIDLV